MMHLFRTLTISLLLATPAFAQLGNANKPPTPDVRPGDSNTPREVERERDKSEEAERAEKADKAKQPKVGKDEANKVKRQIVKEEAKLRKRLAKIERLRELARAQGNEERLRALDHLEAKAHEKYEKKVAKHKAKLNRRDKERLDDKLAKGRNGKAKGPKGPKGEKRGDADSDESHDAGSEHSGRDGVLGNQGGRDHDGDSSNANKRKMKEKAGRGQDEQPGLGTGAGAGAGAGAGQGKGKGQGPGTGKNNNKKKGDG